MNSTKIRRSRELRIIRIRSVKTAELRKLSKRASANGVRYAGADVNAMAFDADGNPETDLSTAYLLDCVVTNCSGNRAGCIAGGNAYRCTFYDCKTFNGGGQCVLRYCNIVSSLFVGCGGKSQLFGNTAKGYNCTIWGSVGSTPQSIYNNGSGGFVAGCLYGKNPYFFPVISQSHPRLPASGGM